ncbi:hypothetical protein [Cellulosimicrobium sp. CpK407]|uniref:hypothetical protein n=1 Tax=unclassified Cellulosimicrobium TaxID=2624466 RepID=UPI003F402D8B
MVTYDELEIETRRDRRRNFKKTPRVLFGRTCDDEMVHRLVHEGIEREDWVRASVAADQAVDDATTHAVVRPALSIAMWVASASIALVGIQIVLALSWPMASDLPELRLAGLQTVGFLLGAVACLALGVWFATEGREQAQERHDALAWRCALAKALVCESVAAQEMPSTMHDDAHLCGPVTWLRRLAKR